MFHTQFVEKINTQFWSILCLRKSCHLWDNMENFFCRTGHATDENMSRAYCILDT